MRIGIDIRPLSGGKHGGVGEYIRNLLPAMFEAAPEHSFHLFYNSRRESKAFLELEKEFDYPNVEFHKFSYPNKFFTFACRYFNRPYIDKLMGGLDVLFSPHFIPAPVSGECKKVITFHDLSFEYFPDYFDLYRRLWHRYMKPSAQAHSADTIIAVSHSTMQDLADIYKVPKQNMHVVYSGICDSVTDPPSSRWGRIKKKYGLRDNYILSLSTIEPRKNLTALIQAFNSLKSENLYLVIAGAKGWSYKEVFTEAERSPRADRIIFTGPVEEREKHFLYKNAGVFVYPSLYEGFGFPPLEAMYTGTPVVVSMMSSLPEITDGAALLINPYRPSDIADAIQSVLADERLADMLSQKGKKRAQEFKWQKTAKETIAVLENACSVE